jgi:hypothetical protein
MVATVESKYIGILMFKAIIFWGDVINELAA